jgi:hypothetical protein
MSAASDERLRAAIRAAIPPIATSSPSRDLWPQVLLGVTPQPARASRLDWALLAAVVAWLVAFPESVVVLLYHL